MSAKAHLLVAVLLVLLLLLAAPAQAQTNEGGQDVSNIPDLGYQSERGACLHAYYDSLAPDDRGWASQSVTYWANYYGISPYEVVGC